jgi:hypothetical protein
MFFSWAHVLLFLVFAVLTMSVWFGYESIKNGPWFLQEFITYQIRLILHPRCGPQRISRDIIMWYCYWVVFPASVLAIPSFFKSKDITTQEQDMKKWMLILFWVVTILFSIVKSRIIHYSSMAWFPVTFLGAFTVNQLLENRMQWKLYITIIVGTIGSVVALLFTCVPVCGHEHQKADSLCKGSICTGQYGS